MMCPGALFLVGRFVDVAGFGAGDGARLAEALIDRAMRARFGIFLSGLHEAGYLDANVIISVADVVRQQRHEGFDGLRVLSAASVALTRFRPLTTVPPAMPSTGNDFSASLPGVSLTPRRWRTGASRASQVHPRVSGWRQC